MKNDPVKDKIIDAAVECIGKYGLESITNRLVAKEANVNHAAINYYFGSKENLLNEAVKRSLDNYLSEFLSLDQYPEVSTRTILQKFLTEVLRDSLSSPHFIKSYLYEPILHNDYNGIFIDRFNTFLKNISNQADIDILGKTKEEVKMAITQIISSLMFVSLLPNFFQKSTDIDFSDSKAQEYYVNYLLDRYCIYKNE